MRAKNAEADHISGLCERLTDKDPEVRKTVVQSLQELPANSLLSVRPQLLVTLFEDPDLWVRKAVAELFAQRSPGFVVDITSELLAKLDDPNKYVRIAIMGIAHCISCCVFTLSVVVAQNASGSFQ